MMTARFPERFALGAFIFMLLASPCLAEEFYCEVMSVEGSATLSNASTSGKELGEGDLLSVDDTITVGPASYIDLAYDRDWNNITRVEENSAIRIRSLYPTTVELESGGVFAKLKSLPKDSSFDVKTPTAIASVRGTEYRTTYLEGETQVYNVSDSDVYVYGFDSAGQTQAEPVIIRNTEKTFVQRRGDAPMAPRRMEMNDIQRVAKFQQGIEHRVMQNIDRGRVGKLPDVGSIERRLEERRQAGGPGGMNPRLRPGQPQTISGDQARQKVEGRFEGAKEEGPRGGGLVSGEGTRERRPEAPGGNRFEGRGIGGPFFPGDESHRTGGPEPAGFPDKRWKSADEATGPREGLQGHGDRPGNNNRPGQPQPQGGKPQGKQQGKAGGKPAPKRN